MSVSVLSFVAHFLRSDEHFLLHVENGEVEDTLYNAKDFFEKPPISGYYQVRNITTAFSIYYDTVICINAVIPDKFFSM